MSDALGFLLSDCARLLRRRFDARARSIGVSRPQWRVLFALTRAEGVNQAMLADILEVETITVGRMVDRLADAGLVERRPDPDDRRMWRLFLTSHAQALLEDLRAVGEEVRAEMMQGINDDDAERLAGMLTLLRTNLSGRAPLEDKVVTL
ncbi:MarR family transcriptional regulator [Sandarakinorhabdus sp.]|uniref:MarR family winged helix-turn-helix transcriptional regulator n=1 Tax=Sandarakinorhabdus sp. TaxID=1916663 RepID=UPI00286E86FC|nr:MarR family transcriptional regulator [Sandarakinorhabdus sp.]